MANEVYLNNNPPIYIKFDIIFCLNVMIYFDEPTKEKLINRFLTRFGDYGYLFIGHSEKVHDHVDGRLKNIGKTIYHWDAK